MAYFNRENQSGGNRNFGKPRFNNARQDMHKATCASCGKICEVPFKPTGSKPVLCRDCFKNSGGSSERRSENRSFGRSEDRPMYDAVCANCGKTCQIPFRPSQGRDVFCSRCFEKNEGGFDTRGPERRTFDKPSFNRDDSQHRTSDTSNYKAQFDSLNAKMDKILSLLMPVATEAAPLESVIDEGVIEEIVEEVKQAEKKPKKAKAVIKKPTAKTKKTSPKKK